MAVARGVTRLDEGIRDQVRDAMGAGGGRRCWERVRREMGSGRLVDDVGVTLGVGVGVDLGDGVGATLGSDHPWSCCGGQLWRCSGDHPWSCGGYHPWSRGRRGRHVWWRPWGRGRRGNLVWGKHRVDSGGPGGSTFYKERLDAGKGIQLGVACDGREVYESTGDYGESVGDAVGRSAGWLGQIGVTELDGVREQQGLGDFFHDVEVAVVVEGRAHVETVALPNMGEGKSDTVWGQWLHASRQGWLIHGGREQ